MGDGVVMTAARNPEERSMRRTLLSLFVAAAVCVAVPQVQAASQHKGPAPDATIELKEGAVAAGIGYSWGGGTLTFKGKKYPVSVTGLSVGSVGVSSVTARGSVYKRSEERRVGKECRL